MDNTIVQNIDQLRTELSEIQDFVEITPSDDVNEVVNRGNDLVAYLARTSKILADAKLMKDEKTNSTFIEEIKRISQLSPTVANKYIDSLCKDENYIVNWAERLNRTCTHQLDWCRSVLSKAKEEMRNLHLPTR